MSHNIMLNKRGEMCEFKHTIRLASALLKHWFCMWLAAQTSVSSSSWLSRFTALSSDISGGLLGLCLHEETTPRPTHQDDARIHQNY